MLGQGAMQDGMSTDELLPDYIKEAVLKEAVLKEAMSSQEHDDLAYQYSATLICNLMQANLAI
jgi:hypothetical protein